MGQGLACFPRLWTDRQIAPRASSHHSTAQMQRQRVKGEEGAPQRLPALAPSPYRRSQAQRGEAVAQGYTACWIVGAGWYWRLTVLLSLGYAADPSLSSLTLGDPYM